MNYIIFDMDDTLLNNARQVLPYTLSVLKQLQAMGHKIVINTARSQQFNQPYFDLLQPDYAILNGGALILDKQEHIVYKAEIDLPTTQAFVADLLTVTENITVQAADGPYSHLGLFTGQNAKPFDFSATACPFSALKIVTAIDSEDTAAALADKYGLTYVSYFGGQFKRFNHPDATKAQGNRKLMELLGGTLSDVIAFGDDLGDLEMLQDAGIGVLMCNAKPHLHRQCRYLSQYTNEEEGVARFLAAHFHLA